MESICKLIKTFILTCGTILGVGILILGILFGIMMF